MQNFEIKTKEKSEFQGELKLNQLLWIGEAWIFFWFFFSKAIKFEICCCLLEFLVELRLHCFASLDLAQFSYFFRLAEILPFLGWKLLAEFHIWSLFAVFWYVAITLYASVKILIWRSEFSVLFHMICFSCCLMNNLV